MEFDVVSRSCSAAYLDFGSRIVKSRALELPKTLKR